MTKDSIIKIPLVSQTEDTKNKKWVSRTCAICSLKMVMAWKNKKLEKIPVMVLVKKELRMDGYLEGVGWKHKALVELAGRYGVKMSFVEKFFDNTVSPVRTSSIGFHVLSAIRTLCPSAIQ